jgi:hydrogenase-4 component E
MAVVDFFAFIFLIAGLLMLAGRIINNNISLLMLQSLALTVIAFYLGLAGTATDWHMLVVGGLTLVIKVLALPVVLY